jgi:integrase
VTRQTQGVRPWKTQRHLTEAQVTAWEIDTAGALDSEGNPLPRIRRQVVGSKSKAIAQRRTLLVDLERAVGCEEPGLRPAAGMASSPVGVESSQMDAGPTPTLSKYVDTIYRKWSKENHKLTTHNVRMKHLKGYILPVLGKVSVEEANKPRSVTKLRDYLDKNPNLEITSKQQLLLSFSAVLTTAANGNVQPDGVPLIDHRIKFNYYRDDTPKEGMSVFDEHGNRVGHSRHKRLDDAAWRETIDACETDEELVLVGLGLWGGCRISEAGARRWKDADLSVPQIFIWSAVCPHTNAITKLKKDNQGWVRIPRRMTDALERLRGRHQLDGYILGLDINGQPLNRAAIEHRYHLILRRTQVKKKNYHALRHTFICRLADAKIPVHEIKQLARHADIETTYGYIEPSRENLMKATEMFDAD